MKCAQQVNTPPLQHNQFAKTVLQVIILGIQVSVNAQFVLQVHIPTILFLVSYVLQVNTAALLHNLPVKIVWQVIIQKNQALFSVTCVLQDHILIIAPPVRRVQQANTATLRHNLAVRIVQQVIIQVLTNVRIYMVSWLLVVVVVRLQIGQNCCVKPM